MSRLAPAALARMLALAAVAALLPATAQAQAPGDEITMGPLDITSGPLAVSAREFTFVQIEDSKRYVLRAPGSGVVREWSVNMQVGGDVKLLALTPNGDGTYRQDSASQTVTVGPGRTDIDTAPVYVAKGDALGLQLVSPDARVWIRIENGGTFMARDDLDQTGGFTSWQGYYALFRAVVRLAPDATALGGVPSGGLPSFGSSGGDSGGSPPPSGSSSPPAPVVSAVAPSSGTTAGGDGVTITGQNFDAVRKVYFGSTEAPSFRVDSTRQISATTPPHAEGPVDVAVLDAGGLSATTSGDVFRFVAPARPAPAPVTSVAPSKAGPRARCVRTPTLIGRTVAGARKLLRRAGCRAKLRIVLVGRRHGHARSHVRKQVPGPRRPMRRDRRVLISVR